MTSKSLQLQKRPGISPLPTASRPPQECDSLLQNFDLRAEVRRNAKKKHEKHGILDMFYHVLTMNIDG
jgi:hypothetical protein